MLTRLPFARAAWFLAAPDAAVLDALLAHSRTASRRPAPEPAPQPAIPADLHDFATQTLAFSPDPIQAAILGANPHRALINCTRQWGKSTIAAIKALHHALAQPRSLTLIASVTRSQAAELLDKVRDFAHSLGLATARLRHHPASLQFPNGSRVIALQRASAHIRGISTASLVLIDEAAFASHDLYQALRPMLATTNGAVWLMSTPNGQSGFFYDAWTNPDAENWQLFSVPATECPRISPEFLEIERRSKSEAEFAREYLCQFTAPDAAVFDTSSLSVSTPVPFVNPAMEVPSTYYIGFDIGQRQSNSALVVLRHTAEYTNRRDPVTYEWVKAEGLYLTNFRIYPKNTRYDLLTFYIAQLISELQLRTGETATFVYDATGCGQMFETLLRQENIGASLAPIQITSGAAPSYQSDNARRRYARACLRTDARLGTPEKPALKQ